MSLPIAIALSFGCGYVALSYELLWYRVYFISKGAIASSFALLLGTYLLALALGAWLSRDYCAERKPTDQAKYLRTIAFFLAVAYVLAFLSLPLYSQYCAISYRDARLPWLALCAGFLGVAFPLTAHASIAPDGRAGLRLSYLYLANIIGSASGSLLTGFWLMNIWPLKFIATFLLWLGLSMVAALFVATRHSFSRMFLAWLSLIAIGLCSTSVGLRWFDGFYERLQLGPKYTAGYRFARVLENRTSVVTISPEGVVHGNGTYDGAVNVDPRLPDLNQIHRAYAVAALHPAPRQVLMIGLSLGSWAQVIAHHPLVEKLTVVELNPGYLQLIAEYPQVSSLLRNPKVEVVIDDGRRWLARNPERQFDLIVFNVMVHWIDSSAHVLSREFLELIRAHLALGGVYYYNSSLSGRSQRTAAMVFSDIRRVSQFVAASDQPIDFNVDRFREVLGHYQIDGRSLFDLGKPDDRAEVERIVLSLSNRTETKKKILARTADLDPITDDNMGYEWDDVL